MMLERLLHDINSRDLMIDDEFTRWYKKFPPERWSKIDLTSCAFGWNAGVEAATNEVAAEIERLRAECEALRKDAERYRWLRDGSRGNSPLAAVLENQYEGDELLFDIDLDYAIDRAMASSAEGQEVKP